MLFKGSLSVVGQEMILKDNDEPVKADEKFLADERRTVIEELLNEGRGNVAVNIIGLLIPLGNTIDKGA